MWLVSCAERSSTQGLSCIFMCGRKVFTKWFSRLLDVRAEHVSSAGPDLQRGVEVQEQFVTWVESMAFVEPWIVLYKGMVSKVSIVIVIA